MKNLKYFFKKAEREKWAIGQFNFCTLEQLRGIVEAAKEMAAPIILGTSHGEVSFFGIEEAVFMRNLLRKQIFPYIYLNLDHGKDFNLIKKAVDLGYDCVHFDGSRFPFKENLRIAKKVVGYAHKKGVLVEGEIGAIGTESSKIYTKKFKIQDKDLADPNQALILAKEAKLDSLAVGIGSFHGVEIKGANPHLRLDRLKEIKAKTKHLPLVLHGGSGTPLQDIKKAIKLGIVKININTELRIAWKKSLIKSLRKNSVKPYDIYPDVTKAIREKTKEKIKLFGSQNKN